MTDKYWAVVNEEGEPLHWDTSPWGDGECLIYSNKHFTLFTEKKSATEALRISKKYAKENTLEDMWCISEWVVEEFKS